MPKCEKFVKAYEACAERIKGDETGEAHCTVRCDAMRARTRGRGGCVRGDSSARGITTDAGTTMIMVRRRRDNTLTCTRAWTSAPRRKSWDRGRINRMAMFGADCASMDTFTDGTTKLAMTSMHVPDPVMSLAITAPSKHSANFSKALERNWD